MVGRSDLSLIPHGAIAGHGGILKLIFSKKDRRLLGVHCFGDIASEIVGIGQMVIHFNLLQVGLLKIHSHIFKPR
jgi:NAD(P) transhydrogenase